MDAAEDIKFLTKQTKFFIYKSFWVNVDDIIVLLNSTILKDWLIWFEIQGVFGMHYDNIGNCFHLRFAEDFVSKKEEIKKQNSYFTA